ncbi:RDD family protein [Photobacterium kishitanii]|uniref:RDD family protein n=1 Tax=Photobacterium kishitanii TaxID=318456 RepID=A0A0B7JG54_9GAMM|nr:RDD family protein [Photobacterium kishitanii]OBU28865.1 branched-chain amino acid aminotransferase I [Photobacterium kishitanii]OBU33792.1 branched-chain amino acid aminotransferase I [Photobacterium kishitanii]PSU90677.1 RDD family protein [Photobacterium kishitanii]PSU99155.1 RDD family protein [Photobacterium kishitanii]PSV17656.1 RDD family protein [Photobacterium kishitanii]
MNDEIIITYIGFWQRVLASLVDTAILALISAPLMYLVYGEMHPQTDTFIIGPMDAIINYILPFVGVILFWIYKSATPGKMVIKAQIVDAKTGYKPTVKQSVIRYLGYFVSTIPLGLGLMWVGWDKRKQGWHDKLANTIVVKRYK